MSLETAVTGVGTFFSSALTWMGDVISMISEQPLLFLMVVCLPVAGYAIGGLRRLIRL